MNLQPGKIITRRSLAMVLAGVFLLVAIFGITFGMKTDEHGNMSGCPYMSEQASVCPMGAMEHIAKWQQLFAATFFKSDTLASLIFLLATFVLLAFFARASDISPLALALYPPVLQNKPETKLFSHLVIVFSQGILNPRLYA